MNRDINKIRKRASRIVTLLPENSLTPIPKKEGVQKAGLANKYDKKELDDAQRTAVFIRRMEYATSMKRQMNEGKSLKNNSKKIALIQEWWKTMYKVIKLQKNVRGFLFRKKLMNNLEHQEKLLQFITEFDNIYNYHLYRQFMDNLKRKRDYEKAKLLEKCEDLSEKLENLERLRDLKNLRKCFEKWRDDTRKRKQNLENFVKRLNEILRRRINKKNKRTLRKIKNTTKNLDDLLNDKAKDFRERNAKKKFLDHLIKCHRLNDILTKVKKKVDDRQKRDALDKLKKYKDIADAAEKLNKLMEDKMKRQAFKDLKTMDFVDKVDDVIKNHNDKLLNDSKKDFLDKLRDMCNKDKLRDKLKKWKDFNDEMKKRKKILDKLIKYKQDELRKKEEEAKKKFAISSGVNDFELISDKKEIPEKKNPVFATSQNDFNFEGKPAPKMVFEKAGQNFSLIAPDKTQFEFGDPLDKSMKNANDPFSNQLDELEQYRNKNNLKKCFDKWNDIANKRNILEKLKDKFKDNLKDKLKIQNLENLEYILTKAKKESDNQLKKDAFDLLKKNNDIAQAVERLEYIMNKKTKKEAFDTLKKNSGINEGLRILDKLFNDHINKDKKDFLDRLKKNADAQKALKNLVQLLDRKIKRDAFNDLIRRNKLGKAFEKLEKLLNDNFKRKFLDNLDKYTRMKNACDKLNNVINKKLKRYYNKWKENAKKQSDDKPKTKRISRRINTNKFKKRKKKNHNKKLLRDAFNKWRKNASFEPTRSVLDRIKKNKLLDSLNDNRNNELLDKYRNKMMQVLLNIYERQRHLILKRYLDKWKRAKGPQIEPEKIEPKYKKKPKIEVTKELSDSEDNSYKPKYYNQKLNLYNRKDSPYRKKYPKRLYEPEEFKYEEPEDEQININPIDKDQYSETSSNNESIMGNGEYLIQNTKVIKQPRVYTSQSFFIDKNKANNAQNNYQVNTHITNQLPMTMKGDFVSLIEQNPKILAQKNPRIQVTNAMCDLDQIINDDNTDDELNTEEVDNEISKLNEDFVINKNKVLSKVIKNCDKDLYASQRPFKAKKDQYYSVSIPLNDNEAKWEFLNNIKGERDKNNLNKFELIQKENEPVNEEKEEKRQMSHKKNRSDRKNQNSIDNSYKLREMNFTQFYRSPIKTIRIEEEEKSFISNKIKRPGERKKTQKSKMNSTVIDLNSTAKELRRDRNNIASYNIDRSRGKIELDPNYRCIDFYDDESD